MNFHPQTRVTKNQHFNTDRKVQWNAALANPALAAALSQILSTHQYK